MLQRRSVPALARSLAQRPRAMPRRGAANVSVPSTASATSEDGEAQGRFFYRNGAVEKWGSKPAVRMTLRQLIMFGQSARRNRELLMESANYVRTELATRIAHRLRDMQTLPFVVMSNETLDSVYQHYWRTFETLRGLEKIESMNQNDQLVVALAQVLAEHESKLSVLSSIAAECKKYMDLGTVDLFLARMLRSQISREVLAKQHMALWAMQSADSDAVMDRPLHSTIGMVDTNLHVKQSVENGANEARASVARQFAWSEDDPRIPEIQFDGDLDARFPYLPTHLEFIVQQLLRVAMQSTVRFHQLGTASGQTRAPPVSITIVLGPPKDDIILRISDQGGGLGPDEDQETTKQPMDRSHIPPAFARGPLLIPGSDSPTHHAGTASSLVWSFANVGGQLETMQKGARPMDQSAMDLFVNEPMVALREGDSLMRLAQLSEDARSALPMYVAQQRSFFPR